MLFNGEQRLANVLALRNAAAAFDAGARGTLEDFVAHLSDLEQKEARESEAVVESQESDVVRLMTVHAAKGLEWPVVVVADMGRGSNLQGPRARIDRVLGVSLKRPGEESDASGPPQGVARDREEAEEMRVFYVAATRARDHLVLSGARAPRGHGQVEGDEDCESSGTDAKPWGWMRSVLSLLEIDANGAKDYDFEGAVVEYSCPTELARSTGSHAATLLEMRDDILAGRALPAVESHEADAVARRVAPLSGEAFEIDRLTATGIGDFGKCALKFELAHLRGLPPLRVLEEPSEAKAPRFLVGTAVHAALETVRPGERLVDALERVLADREQYAAAGEALAEEARGILEHVEASANYRRIVRAEGAREAAFAFLIDGCLVEGKIDRVLAGEVVDFKSDDVAEREAAEYAELYRGQMDVYALAYARLRGEPPERQTLFFLRPGVEVAWKCGEEGLAAAEERVRGIIEGIKAGPPYPPARPHYDCRCEYRALCRIISARRPTGPGASRGRRE